MRQPIRWDLYGDRGLDLVDTLPIVGQDFTGATLAAHVKRVPDAAGSPLLTPTVTLVYGGTATVSAHIAAGRIGVAIYGYVNPATNAKYVAGDSIAVSVIKVAVAAASMVDPNVPAMNPPGDNVVLAWNLLITPSGGIQDKWVFGDFIVRGTV